MEEETKELKTIDDIELDEDYEPTKKIEDLTRIEEKLDEEYNEDDEINEDIETEEDDNENENEDDEGNEGNNRLNSNKKSNKIKHKKSHKNHNKEKNNDEEKEEYENKRDKDKNKKKSNKKKIIIISVLSIILIILIAVAVFLLLNKNNKKDEPKRSEYYKTIAKELDNKTLGDKFDKALAKNDIDAGSVKVISIDIDSDNKQDLVAYAEDSNKKYILNFDVSSSVTYEDSYQVTSSSSIGYAYSKEDKNTYYYTEYNNQYTVISDTKKIMSKEEFEENYYVVTTKYDNSNILDDAIDYDLDDDLDIEELENNKITKKSLLKSNNLTTSTVEDKAIKYFTDKQKEQEKLAKEKEEQEKLEAEERKKNAGFTLGEYTMKYGKYVGTLSDMKETITLNYDLTATYESSDGKTYTCTWTVGTATDGQDALTAVEAPAVNLTCNGINLSVFAQSKTALRDTDLWVYNYAG